MEKNEQVRTDLNLKLLIPIADNDVAPRFDLAGEVLIVHIEGNKVLSKRTIVMPHPSPEDLCAMLLRENIQVLVCNGIEEEYYQYLRWKKITVIDSVMSSYPEALEAYLENRLSAESGGN